MVGFTKYFYLLLMLRSFCVYSDDKVVLDHCVFSRVFHKIVKKATTTTRRKENKVTVHEKAAAEFIEDVARVLGDDKVGDEKLKRLQFREKPDSPDEEFITETDYLPVIKGAKDGEDGSEELYKAYIRMRRYFVVPKGTKTIDVAGKGDSFRRQKLVDQMGEYVKLEFKVGYPEVDRETGEPRDVPGVVDKPGIVIARADSDKLFANKASFIESRASALQRCLELTSTNNAQTKSVNKQDQVETLFERIGMMHDLIPASLLQPHHKTVYQRTARTIVFDHPPEMVEQGMTGTFEVQITVDDDILVQNYVSEQIHFFKKNDRVVELKIPTAYANLSDGELRGMGLGDLAKIRKMYLDLDPRPGTVRDRGKTKNAPNRK